MQKDLLLCYENDDFIVQAGVIGSKPGHPLMKKLMDFYENREYNEEQLSNMIFNIGKNQIKGYTICNLISSVV
jgi:hypothetical protein